MEFAIDVRNVTKRYEDFQLDNVSFQVPKGSIVGFVGENGAGKTTMMKAILDIISIDEGEIGVMGSRYSELDFARKAQIGVVFDENHFPELLHVWEIAKIMQGVYKNYWEQEIFKKYVKKFRLPDKKAIKDYSRGMKMKLGIAVALSHGSKLLVLDEATSGLDPIIRDEILDIFLDFIQDEEHSILLSSHIISDLEKIADYITFIHQGRILISESKDELLYDYSIVKCGEKDLQKIDSQEIIAVKRNRFGIEALVKGGNVSAYESENFVIENTSIEEIILMLVKGEHI